MATTHAVERPVTLTPLQVHARYGQHWSEQGAEVYVLRGECQLRSADRGVTAEQVVLWRVPMGSGVFQVDAYLYGNVQALQNGRREVVPSDFYSLQTGPCPVSVDRMVELQQPSVDPVYGWAVARRNQDAAQLESASDSGTPVRPVQYAAPGVTGPQLTPQVPAANPLPLDRSNVPFIAPPPAVQPVSRHVSIYPRALGAGFSMQTIPSENTVPPEYVTTVTGGVRIVVDGVPVDLNGQTVLSTIDLAADRAIIWTDAERVNEFSTSIDLDGQTPFQVYLEGDIVIRQGTTYLTAERAFYDLNDERGMLSDAEVRGFLPEINSAVRLRAAQIRQLSHDKFHAQQGWITTSDMGIPGYRIEASDIFIERRHIPGVSQVDPQTGQMEGGMLWFTSSRNKLYVENIPVGYFPYISSPAENPNIPLRSINFGYSTMFGAQIRTGWDVESLFGLNLPDGMDWRLNVDYLSKRGPMVGTQLKHTGPVNLFGVPATTSGTLNADFIRDSGDDLLGVGRRNLAPETQNRGRAVLRNRLDFPFNTWLNTELGYLTDRNFLEQYYETDWDTGKDYESLLQLNHQVDNFTASILGRGHLYDFENTTDWLPRGDVTLLGQPLGNTPLLWSTHSSVGYAQLNAATPPNDPLQDPFTPLPYFVDRNGVVAMSRHQVELPLTVGPANVVPYALGEAAYWQQDMSGDSLGRLYGSAGVRGSLMFTKYMPQVYSSIFGLNGLAHKMTFDADYSYSQSTAGLNQIAQYNEFDENAQERFRERFVSLEFGGVLPGIYDPRNYAVRSGAGRSVTAPWHELVDDQHVVRLGWRHRLQTRVGNPQAPRIYDWMTLDLEASVFPNAQRDNFGETVGLLSANYAWHVGPETSLLANTVFDVFDGGQKTWNIGMLTSRRKRGSLYVGLRGLDIGPIDTTLLIASMSYHPSEKWIWTAGTSYDILAGQDRGQTFTVTRVGEYLLFVVGAGYDSSRSAWSFNFSISPKFGNFRSSTTQLRSLTGTAL
ncbi:MAG: hypothetical protein ACK5Q5_23690 [Planctomycetaceae bacterium]